MTATIYSGSDKGLSYFGELLAECGAQSVVSSVPDLYIVDAPLRDEFGDEYAAALAQRAMTLLIVRRELYEKYSERLASRGVMVMPKPLSRDNFKVTLKMLSALSGNLITDLREKLEDTKLTHRAKLVLIASLRMTEPQAHKFIEKQAMDRRVSKREVALSILNTYDKPAAKRE
ncbi:MAG: ANTAR domain-containing protein [Oscillospiraceae bacterium]|jgi:response regulator NasT|nr:ANTAR domain-containing protein [Oscillospiraceae bacterium]